MRPACAAVRAEDVSVKLRQGGRPLFNGGRRVCQVLPGQREVPSLGVHLDDALLAPTRGKCTTGQDVQGHNEEGQLINGLMAHNIINHFGSRLRDHLAPEVLADNSKFLLGMQRTHDKAARSYGTSAAVVVGLHKFATYWDLTIPSTEEMTVDLRELCLV